MFYGVFIVNNSKQVGVKANEQPIRYIQTNLRNMTFNIIIKELLKKVSGGAVG